MGGQAPAIGRSTLRGSGGVRTMRRVCPFRPLRRCRPSRGNRSRHTKRANLAARLLAPLLALLATLPAPGVRAELGDRPADARPNILWITAEDLSPLLGSYGETLADTPQLDALAAGGLRFAHAYANYPVCAPARSTLIFGIYASTLGTEPMRSFNRVPPWFRLLPQYLRMAGYYTANNAKTDYNFWGNGHAAWDASGPDAHYRNRPSGKPFFAVFNLDITHESKLSAENITDLVDGGLLPATPRVNPAAIRLPPYHPDRPEVRDDWARQHDLVSALDRQVGALLAELDAAGLAEDTIVFFFADHGGALARSKRFLYDTGTRVPLILRIPARFARLAPEGRIGVSERLVSFVDFAPTLLAVAGMPPPPQMQGQPFLGASVRPAAPVVLLARGRMDERDDLVRAVTDGRFRYVRNFQPQRPDGRHLRFPFRMQANWNVWAASCAAGECNAAQRAFWEPRPGAALFHTAADPWEVENLIDDPAYAEAQQHLGRRLEQALIAIRDLGFVPESMLPALAGDRTPYEYGQSSDYPVARVVALALAVTANGAQPAAAPSPALAERVAAALTDPHPVLRYWGAMGALLHPPLAETQSAELRALARDDTHSAVRAAAAAALAGIGEEAAAEAVLLKLLESDDDIASLEVMNRIEDLGWIERVPRPLIRRIAGDADRPRSAEIAADWRSRRSWMFLPW